MSTPAPDMNILIEWALHSRPDWEPQRLDAAVAGARTAQWAEVKIATHLIRMVFDAGAGPWDLSAAAREPQGTAACVPAPREVWAEAMAQMRSASRASLERRAS